MPSFFVGEGTECPASAGGEAWWSDGLELDEAPDDQGTQGPGGVLSVQQVRSFESSEQEVAVDPLLGDGSAGLRAGGESAVWD